LKIIVYYVYLFEKSIYIRAKEEILPKYFVLITILFILGINSFPLPRGTLFLPFTIRQTATNGRLMTAGEATPARNASGGV